MGAVAKNPIPQLVPLAGRTSSSHFVPGSATRAQMIGLKDAQRLSQFVPVIVLVPAASVDNRSVPTMAAQNISSIEHAGTELLLQFLENSVPQFKANTMADGLAFSDVRVSFSAMEATRKGRPVALTPLEFKTLKYLAQNPRRVITRDELLNEVWGYENYPCTRTVDNLILKLRQKLEKVPSRPAHFHTVHGAGYKFLP